jgi:hypothetical protein
MFAYNPSVNDNSGQILAAGQVGAAQANAQMMGQVGQDIGGALASIGGMLGSAKQENAQADSAFDAISAIGQMYPGMKKISSALEGMDPRTRRLASMSILDNLGAISQLGIAGMNNQTRTAQQGLTARMPMARVAADAQAKVAAGQGTMGMLQNVNLDYVKDR